MSPKTDPEYSSIAYEDAILQDLIVLLQRKYLPDDAGEPSQVLLCHDVFHCDAEVPEGAFVRVIGQLESRRVELAAEKSKFSFGREDEPTESTSKNSESKKGSKASSKGQRNRRTK